MYEDPNQVIKVTAGVSDEEWEPQTSENLFASVTGQTADVIIHEGTHQVAQRSQRAQRQVSERKRRQLNAEDRRV